MSGLYSAQEGYGFVPSDEEDGVDDDANDYLYDEDEDADEDDDIGVENGDRDARENESKEAGTGHQAASGTPATPGAAIAAPPVAGAAADAEARKQARKNSKKKKKKSGLGIVQQLKAKAEGNCASDGITAANKTVVGGKEAETATEGKEESQGEVPPPDMGLLDAVAAMILGEFVFPLFLYPREEGDDDAFCGSCPWFETQ